MEEQKSVTRNLNAELRNQPDLLRQAQKAEAAAQSWQSTWAEPAILSTAAGTGAFASPQAEAHGKELLDRARTDFNSLSRSLTVKRNEDGRNLNTATTILAVVVAGGVVILIGGLLALRIVLRRWVVTPLGLVSSDARRVTRGDLGHEISAPEPVEILELGKDIEAMRQRIVQEFQEVEAARHKLDELNEELRRSNLELEQFAYVASHDLQEPLRKVTSFVRLLQQRYEGQLDERADQYIAFTVDGATRMQQLISDLLAFSRVGRDTDRFELIPLRECVDAAVGDLEVLINETGARIQVADLPAVRGDRALLTSLWQNLIGNSVKFRSAETPEVSIVVEATGTQWQFSITDNGIGIEPRFAEKVFVIFQRLHGRDAYPGTGIGLALCREDRRLPRWTHLARHRPSHRDAHLLYSSHSGEVSARHDRRRARGTNQPAAGRGRSWRRDDDAGSTLRGEGRPRAPRRRQWRVRHGIPEARRALSGCATTGSHLPRSQSAPGGRA